MQSVLTPFIALSRKAVVNSREVSDPFNQSAEKGVTSPTFQQHQPHPEAPSRGLQQPPPSARPRILTKPPPPELQLFSPKRPARSEFLSPSPALPNL